MGAGQHDHEKMDPATVVDVLHWLSMTDFSLSRLKLYFGFGSRLALERNMLDSIIRTLEWLYDTGQETPDYLFDPLLTKFARDTAIAKAVADLRISDKINIQLMEKYDTAGASFESFADPWPSRKTGAAR